MEHITLFTDILPEEQERMSVCFKVREAFLLPSDSQHYYVCAAAEKNTGKFKLPMSYTALAQYLSVDRSAMMREIKNLTDEGVLRRDGRNVELLM